MPVMQICKINKLKFYLIYPANFKIMFLGGTNIFLDSEDSAKVVRKWALQEELLTSLPENHQGNRDEVNFTESNGIVP